MAEWIRSHASALYRQGMITELLNQLWPNGLDPEGTPTPPWQP